MIRVARLELLPGREGAKNKQKIINKIFLHLKKLTVSINCSISRTILVMRSRLATIVSTLYHYFLIKKKKLSSVSRLLIKMAKIVNKS